MIIEAQNTYANLLDFHVQHQHGVCTPIPTHPPTHFLRSLGPYRVAAAVSVRDDVIPSAGSCCPEVEHCSPGERALDGRVILYHMINHDMGMYDTILVPADGSAGFERVITHAGELARLHDAAVVALYVVDATSYTGLPMEASWEGVRDVLEGRGETALAEVERLLADDIEVETTTAEGRPSREVVNVARERGVDCIVMGTHGRAGIDRLILGSVAERVVRTAPMPVVTVGFSADEVEETSESGPEAAAAGPG
jgi:nucleotide-binding universal stress UspA family protein